LQFLVPPLLARPPLIVITTHLTGLAKDPVLALWFLPPAGTIFPLTKTPCSALLARRPPDFYRFSVPCIVSLQSLTSLHFPPHYNLFFLFWGTSPTRFQRRYRSCFFDTCEAHYLSALFVFLNLFGFTACGTRFRISCLIRASRLFRHIYLVSLILRPPTLEWS